MSRRTSPLAATVLLVTACAFGANHVAARFAFDSGLSVITAVTIRSCVTAIALLAAIVLMRAPIQIKRHQATRALMVGALFTIQSFCLYSAVARLPVALALLAFNTFPVMIALLHWIVYKTRPPRAVAIASPIILIGLALALDVSGAATKMTAAARWEQLASGLAFALSASLLFSVGMLITERHLVKVDARVRTLVVMLTMTVLAFAASLASGGFEWPQTETGWWAIAIFSVLYAAAFTTVFTLLPRLGAVGSSPLMNVEPIAALGMGWLILNQTVAPLQLVGAALVIGAVMWLGFRRT